MTTYSLAYYRECFDRYGYGIFANAKDVMGRQWVYKTAPIRSGGPINYFDNKEELDRYLKLVKQIRKIEEELGPIKLELEDTDENPNTQEIDLQKQLQAPLLVVVCG